MSDYTVAVKQDNHVLSIDLPSVLDRKNASDVFSQILEHLSPDIQSILFNAKNLRFISADGLDVILETKKRCPNVYIDRARIGICDTLKDYGFDHFLNITKQYRFVSVEGCTVIGQGGHGTIYKIGEDTIVKVYRDHSALEVIEKERQFARNAFVNGIPTAIAYDVVKTEQGYGVMFEMINGMTLGQYLAKHPEKVDEYSVRFAKLLLSLHSTYADPDLYEDFHDVYLERMENTKAFIPDKEAETLKKVVLSIPRGDVMVHGDFHPNNVMIDDEGELLLIDMADISRGNGFFDLGGTYMVMFALAGIPILAKKIKSITSLDRKTCRKMWEQMMRTYFQTDNEESLASHNAQFRAFSNLRIAASLGMKSSRSPIVTKLMSLYTRKFIVPKTKKYIELFSTEKS